MFIARAEKANLDISTITPPIGEEKNSRKSTGPSTAEYHTQGHWDIKKDVGT